MSPTARNMPVDSMKVTNITVTIVAIANGSKCGRPKWNGITMPTHGACVTPSMFTRPSANAMMKPATMPSSTEILARKPLANLLMSRINISTSSDSPR